MNPLPLLRRSMQLAAAVTVGMTGFSTAAIAGTPVEPSQTIAQAGGSLVGQCRAVKHSTPVFSQRDPRSPAPRLLNTNQEVTLSDNGGTDGFIGVSAPTAGFVYTANLKSCGGTNPPPTGTCRRVIQPDGLVIRSRPDSNSPVANPSFAPYLSQVTLTTNPPTIQRGPEGRIWVQIAQPASGWVSNGFAGGNSNLGICL